MKSIRFVDTGNEKAFSLIGMLIVLLILGFMVVKGLNLYVGGLQYKGGPSEDTNAEDYLEGKAMPITNQKQQQSVLDSTMKRIHAAEQTEQQRAQDIMNGFDEKNYR